MKTKLCKKCGWLYNPELSTCPVCGDIVKKKNCHACGQEIDNYSQRKYCKSCKKEMIKIYHKNLERTKRQLKFKDGTMKKSESIKKALDEIKVSDVMFHTDRCNQDCDNCKYDDCILPEED